MFCIRPNMDVEHQKMEKCRMAVACIQSTQNLIRNVPDDEVAQCVASAVDLLKEFQADNRSMDLRHRTLATSDSKKYR